MPAVHNESKFRGLFNMTREQKSELAKKTAYLVAGILTLAVVAGIVYYINTTTHGQMEVLSKGWNNEHVHWIERSNAVLGYIPLCIGLPIATVFVYKAFEPRKKQLSPEALELKMFDQAEKAKEKTDSNHMKVYIQAFLNPKTNEIYFPSTRA